MKKSLIFISICFLSLGLFAQRERTKNLEKLDQQVVHWGYSLGLNVMDFVIRPADNFLENSMFDTIYAVEVRRSVGINVNILVNFRLAKYLDVRIMPGLNFGQRTLEYKYLKDGGLRRHSMLIESAFLDIPVLFKYRAERINNWRPFLIAGASLKVDLASQRKIDPEEMPKIRLKPVDLYYQVGLGVDFFLEYFMFGVEVKGVWGAFNIVAYDNSQFTQYYKKLNSRMLMISFHFEGGKLDFINWGRKKRR